MNESFLPLAAKRVTILILLFTSALARAAIYDVKADWSDVTNPNGPWSYNESIYPLPHVFWWQQISGGWSNAQPAWPRSEDAGTRLPTWFKSNGSEDFIHDYREDDVVVHATDDVNGVRNVLQTSRGPAHSGEPSISQAEFEWGAILAGQPADAL